MKKRRYHKADVEQAKIARSCIEYCFCTGESKRFPNVTIGDKWKRATHMELFALDQTMCPDIKKLTTSNP